MPCVVTVTVTAGRGHGAWPTLSFFLSFPVQMIAYKVKEMQVHPASRTNTHIYRKENFGIK
jgi:hypothetical protein